MISPREAELTRQLEAALAALAALRQENQLLRGKVDQLVKRLFGSSSEALPQNQLELALALKEVEVIQPALATPAPREERSAARPARKTRVPENLPVVEEVIDPESVNAYPDA